MKTRKKPTWKDPSIPYQAMLKYMKEKGAKIYHRNLKGRIGGLFNPSSNTISVSKDRKNTEEGCFILAHEWAHWLQCRNGEFSWFFAADFEATEANIDEVIHIEIETDIRAVRFCKMFGVNYKPKSLSSEGKEDHVAFWRKYYLGGK